MNLCVLQGLVVVGPLGETTGEEEDPLAVCIVPSGRSNNNNTTSGQSSHQLLHCRHTHPTLFASLCRRGLTPFLYNNDLTMELQKYYSR